MHSILTLFIYSFWCVGVFVEGWVGRGEAVLCFVEESFDDGVSVIINNLMYP